MDQHDSSSWGQDTYRTGSTRPPKSYGGVIAFLLAVVIFLCGVITALGLMNIRLFRSVSEQKSAEAAPVAFSNCDPALEADNTCLRLGFCGQEIPELWSLYQQLPRGIYVTDVQSGTDAAKKGVQPGDILVQLEGKAITTARELTELLAQHSAPVDATFYRSGKEIRLTLALED